VITGVNWEWQADAYAAGMQNGYGTITGVECLCMPMERALTMVLRQLQVLATVESVVAN